MKTYKEKLDEIKRKQELLKEKQKQLMNQFNEEKRKTTLRRQSEIGKILEETIECEIEEIESLKSFFETHAAELRETQL
ncbi:MAG: hypothetical protein IKF80_07080 [Erysipelotrichaceae bacterium]|nr:hypothetical protein [Erysipelotrichaceae bacterium]